MLAYIPIREKQVLMYILISYFFQNPKVLVGWNVIVDGFGVGTIVGIERAFGHATKFRISFPVR